VKPAKAYCRDPLPGPAEDPGRDPSFSSGVIPVLHLSRKGLVAGGYKKGNGRIKNSDRQDRSPKPEAGITGH
jgi:hypothetical protein